MFRHVRVVIALGPAVCLAALFFYVGADESKLLRAKARLQCVLLCARRRLDPIGSDFLLSHQRNRASRRGVERERNESELKEQTVIDKRR